jgi:hypothetical protein
LRSAASDDVKSYDLAWLEHLVGDVHQPPHAVSRFTHEAPAGDRGGNSVHLCADRGARPTPTRASGFRRAPPSPPRLSTGPIGRGLGPYAPTTAYIDAAQQISRGRAALAGRLIAALINTNRR